MQQDRGTIEVNSDNLENLENPEVDLSGLVLPERIEITGMSEDGRSADFVIEPLERGFGHTLGNSVRRVLLSSLPGAAVRAFRISGVVHEHQTIPSVVEDVHQVIQNLKSIVLSLDDDVDEVVLDIRAQKAGPVTAAGIRGPGSVTVHNPRHHILTLEDDLEVNVELYVDKGRGYVLADQQQSSDDAAVDLVRIDAIYNPVLRANFKVEETRVGQRTDFDRLMLHVETNGAIDPETAVKYSAALVRRHLEYMFFFQEGGPPVEEEPAPEPVSEKIAELLEKPINDLAELSVRSRNSLQRESIDTVADLAGRTETEMLEIDNFGEKSLGEIYDFLAEHGLRLGMKTTRGKDGQLYWAGQAAPAGAGE